MYMWCTRTYIHTPSVPLQHIQSKWLNINKKNLILAAILIIFLKRGPPYWRKLPTDLADFRKQTAEDNFLPLHQFWRKSEQNCDCESALTKKCKNGRHDVIVWKFQNPRKTDLANICQIICRKFHQNPSIRLGCSAVTHTHTYTHTHIHTHTHPRFHRKLFSQIDWI